MTSVVPDALCILAAVGIGLYAVSMSILARRLEAASRLPAFLGPLTWLASLLALSAAVAAQATARPGRWSALVAAVLMALDAVTYFGSLALGRPGAGHRGRAVAGLAAFVAALLSLARVG